MAVTSVSKKQTVALKLDNGTTSSGGIKTVSVSMGSLNKDAMNIEKAYAIALLIGACLSKSVYSIEQVITNAIHED